MAAETAEIRASQAAAPVGAGRVRLLTLADLDRRTRAARKAEALFGEIVADMGGEGNITAGERQLAQRAAIMGALIEHMESLWLAGSPIELGDYLPAANAQRRVLATLGLERRARHLNPPDPLAYAASKAKAA